MTRQDELQKLVNDFVFRDRRIADHPAARVTVFLRTEDVLRCVTRSGPSQPDLSSHVFRFGEGVTGFAAARREIAVIHRVHLAMHTLACPILTDSDCVGVVAVDSQESLNFQDRDIARIQVLAALIAYEVRHLRPRLFVPSALSEGVGRVLRAAREELNLTQDALAERVGTSRIALSRWEAGAQPPTRTPLRRWAEALGILAGGRATLITIVDATPRLVEILQRDPSRVSELLPEQFETLVADRLKVMGYDVQPTGPTTLKDGGIDLIAVPRVRDVASFLLAVQVKHHRGNRATGREAVDRLVAWQNTVFRLGLLVTNTRFTRDALWVATRENTRHFVRLRDFTDLTRWLHGVFTSDEDWREIPDVIDLAPGISVRIPKPQFVEARTVWPLKTVIGPDA